MTRDEIIENLSFHLAHSAKWKIKLLRLESGAEFGSDATIHAPEGINETLEVADKDHPLGIYFHLDDIVELRLC